MNPQNIEGGTEMRPARKTGRCANGFERDKGAVVHWISNEAAAAAESSYSFLKATCGATPGPNTAGWHPLPGGTALTCPACIRRQNQTRKAA